MTYPKFHELITLSLHPVVLLEGDAQASCGAQIQ
jgi:hypothetical protein